MEKKIMQVLKDILCFFGFHNYKLFAHIRLFDCDERKVFERCTNCGEYIEHSYKLGKRKDG